MKNIYKGFVLLVAILFLQITILPPNQALADNQELELTELSVKVMPEFTNPQNWDANIPSLLVGYHGTFTNHSDKPYSDEITMKIPTHLSNFQASFVAQFKDLEDTEPTPEEYKVNAEEGTISWVPNKPIAPKENYYFVVEYFSAPIKGVEDHTFTFEFIPNTAIKNLNIEVYAPYKAENFKLDKKPNVQSQSFGLELYMYEYKNVKQDEVYKFNVSYKKDNIVTTMEALNDMSAPNDDTHSGINQDVAEKNDSPVNTENSILIILIIVIVFAFFFIIFRQKKAVNKQVREKAETPKKIVNKEDEIKKLRKMLADGQIDEKTYKERRSKLG